MAAEAVHKSFYVDNGLVGADYIEEAIQHNVNCKIFSYMAAFHSASGRVAIKKALRHVSSNHIDLFLINHFQT